MPETFAELIERENIRPAPYLGRYKWVMLDRLDALAAEDLKDLVRQSYEIVAAKSGDKYPASSTPRKRRKKPVEGVRSKSKRR
jgi:predicted DNA-binding protein (MmcQ/YjbR family)